MQNYLSPSSYCQNTGNSIIIAFKDSAFAKAISTAVFGSGAIATSNVELPGSTITTSLTDSVAGSISYLLKFVLASFRATMMSNARDLGHKD